MTQMNYMDLSRDYYAAQGYDVPYKWARFDSVPFKMLEKPLSDCRVTLVTTAMPNASFTRDTRSLQFCGMDTLPDSLYTGELFWDADATHTDDLGSYFPIRLLHQMSGEQRIGSLAEHYYCVPTNYSQRTTLEQDAPAIVDQCAKEEVDVAILIPL